jgi:hypothetical protein
MASADPLRQHLARLLVWEDAHAGFDSAVKDLPAALRGKVPDGLPYSPWQLVEHIRITQDDILEFCRNPRYEEKKWPEDYWPRDAAPRAAKSWDESIAAFRRDRDGMVSLANDDTIDLFAKIPHGSGQTYLREILLVADHTAHHVGELIVVRRLLGTWPPT